MARLFFLALMLGLSGASVNFTSVFEWDALELEWPSEEAKQKATQNGRYKPALISPDDLVFYENRAFVSLIGGLEGVPVTLAWLPTDAPSPSPKLNPYPSWEMHEKDNCSTMQQVRGLETDPLGRLWVVDLGSVVCPAKLWIFDLNNDSQPLLLVHQFPRNIISYNYTLRWMHDLVLDEGLKDCLAYIAEYFSRRLIVFSLKSKTSRVTQISMKPNFNAVALSPVRERDLLYLAVWNTPELYAVPVADLRSGQKSVLTPTLLGTKTASSKRLHVDSKGRLYFDLKDRRSIGSWDTTAPFKEEVFYKDELLTSYRWPFAIAFDVCDNIWLMTRDKNNTKNFQLLKAAAGVKSYLYDDFDVSTGIGRYKSCDSAEKIDSESTTRVDPALFSTDATAEETKSPEEGSSFVIALIWTNVLSLVILGCVILWLVWRQKRAVMATNYRNDLQKMSSLQMDDDSPRSSSVPFYIENQ